MKNLELNIQNIKRTLTSVVAAGIVITTGSMTVKAETTKVTVQDVVNAMITGNKITAEITQEEADKLVIEAEKAIEEAGVSLLPDELIEQYNKTKETKKEEKVKNLGITAGLCDTLLNDGTAKMMSYPEAIQFENLCEDVCDQLIEKGYTAIYSSKQSEFYGSDTYTELEEIKKQSCEIKESKKTTYITAIKTDLGFYDDCFGIEPDEPEEEINPPTGISMAPIYGGLALSGSALITAALAKRKKEEKGKTYTKKR